MKLAVAAVLSLTLLTAHRADAGIVNVTSALTTEADEGLSGSITGSADYRTGNISLLILGADGVVRYRHHRHLVVGIARGFLARNNDPLTTFAKRTLEHLRYRYQINDRLLGEVFAQHEFDQFRRLTTRALLGAGPNLAVIDQKRLALGVGLSYMLELESLSENPAAADSGDEELAHRASSYVTFRYQVDDRVQLVDTAYAQPRLSDPSDIRLLNEITLVVKLGETLALSTTFALAHDTEVPELVEKTDTGLKSAITFNF